MIDGGEGWSEWVDDRSNTICYVVKTADGLRVKEAPLWCIAELDGEKSPR